MIKTVLVPLSAASGKDSAFQAALGVARLFGSHIDFLYAHANPVDTATQAAEYLGGAIVSAKMIERLEASAARKEEAALTLYHNFCDREHLSADVAGPSAGTVSTAWLAKTGSVAELVAAYGQASDLLVLGRPGSDTTASSTPVLEAALLDTGRPVLVAGTEPPALNTVAIAWKPTREAARAVTAALPFLTRAKRIVVMVAPEQGLADRDSCERLVGTLRRHCPIVASSYLGSEPDVGAALLAAASKLGAGLLVMGAYGHWRMREFLFGGVTQHVIRNAAVPVLTAH
jgi:nucleotide-binding universal stress UspA family protein